MSVILNKWTIENGEWVKRPFVLTIDETGLSDQPAEAKAQLEAAYGELNSFLEAAE